MKLMLSGWRLSMLFPVVLILGCSHAIVLKNITKTQFSWPMYGRTPSHTNSFSSSLEPPLYVVWKRKLSAAPAASAVFSDGIVYTSTQDGQVHAFSVHNGEKKGSLKYKGGQSAAPLFYNNRLFIGMDKGNPSFYCYDITSGNKVWEKNLGSIYGSPIIFQSCIYICSVAGRVFCLDPAAGDTIWTWKGKEIIYASPAAADSLIYIGGIDGTISALNYQTGNLLWQASEKRTLRCARNRKR